MEKFKLWYCLEEMSHPKLCDWQVWGEYYTIEEAIQQEDHLLNMKCFDSSLGRCSNMTTYIQDENSESPNELEGFGDFDRVSFADNFVDSEDFGEGVL